MLLGVPGIARLDRVFRVERRHLLERLLQRLVTELRLELLLHRGTRGFRQRHRLDDRGHDPIGALELRHSPLGRHHHVERLPDQRREGLRHRIHRGGGAGSDLARIVIDHHAQSVHLEPHRVVRERSVNGPVRVHRRGLERVGRPDGLGDVLNRAADRLGDLLIHRHRDRVRLTRLEAQAERRLLRGKRAGRHGKEHYQGQHEPA